MGAGMTLFAAAAARARQPRQRRHCDRKNGRPTQRATRAGLSPGQTRSDGPILSAPLILAACVRHHRPAPPPRYQFRPPSRLACVSDAAPPRCHCRRWPFRHRASLQPGLGAAMPGLRAGSATSAEIVVKLWRSFAYVFHPVRAFSETQFVMKVKEMYSGSKICDSIQ